MTSESEPAAPGADKATDTAPEAIVRVEGVSKIFGQGDVKVKALSNVELAIGRGEFVALAGPSGSGKSTLLNIISGLDHPTSGRVFIEGRDTTALSRSELSRLRMTKIGFVFQSYNLLPVLTALENAEYVLMLQGMPLRPRREKVRAILRDVGLAGMEDRFPNELSGGQQQRVAIARAIASQPALILADEPTANLDSKTGAGLMDLMVRLNTEKGTTFLFSSHDGHVLRRARRLIGLTDGKITSDGPPDVAALG